MESTQKQREGWTDMKIERHYVKRVELGDFADMYNLTLEIHEREIGTMTHLGPKQRFYAHFSHVEVAKDGCLVGAFGDGESPLEAVENYCRKISGKRIRISTPYRESYRVDVPHLICWWDGMTEDLEAGWVRFAR